MNYPSIKVGDICKLDKNMLLSEGYIREWVDLVTKTEVVVLSTDAPVLVLPLIPFKWKGSTYGKFKLYNTEPLVLVERKYIIL